MVGLTKRAILVAAALLLSVSANAAMADKLKVVASFSIIGDLAKQVGGDRVDIVTLVGADGDAHVYEPRPAAAAALAAADVVLVNGLNFEGFLQRLVDASGTKAPVVALSKGIEALQDAKEAGHRHDTSGDDAQEGAGGHHGTFDPHAWQSVPAARLYVTNIADAFCAADPAGCEAYRMNAAVYGKQLDALDGAIRAAITGIPEERRIVITSHDAFGYFAREYSLTFLAPEGISTEAEASAADVAALIRQVRQDKASAIFLENITNPRLVEQISMETGIKVGGRLYSDALSDESGPAASYVDMMRHNINAITGAIQGD